MQFYGFLFSLSMGSFLWFCLGFVFVLHRHFWFFGGTTVEIGFQRWKDQDVYSNMAFCESGWSNTRVKNFWAMWLISADQLQNVPKTKCFQTRVLFFFLPPSEIHKPWLDNYARTVDKNWVVRAILFSKKEGLWNRYVTWNTGVLVCVCYQKWNKCEQALQRGDFCP